MRRLLFDTTFLIDTERSGDELDGMIDDDDDVALAAITIAELRVGALLATAKASRRTVVTADAGAFESLPGVTLRSHRR